MGLSNAKDALGLFCRSQTAVFNQAIKYSQTTVVCGTGPGTGIDWWYCGPASDEPVTATLIGYDSTSCVPYYHLEDGQCFGVVVEVTEGCAAPPVPGFPTNPETTIDTSSAGVSQGVALNKD